MELVADMSLCVSRIRISVSCSKQKAMNPDEQGSSSWGELHTHVSFVLAQT